MDKENSESQETKNKDTEEENSSETTATTTITTTAAQENSEKNEAEKNIAEKSVNKEENTNTDEKIQNSDENVDEEISESLETTAESKQQFEEEKQEVRELPKFGRKVFFLNPPLSVSSYVMDNLKEEQYEVYIIPDYKVAKQILRLSPNAICFIFIDDMMPLRGWFNFIQSFENDETLKTIFLGVLSERIRPKDKENFLMNLKLPGGFVSLGGAIVEVLKNLEGILKINGAKGQRQYVKLNCTGLTNINGYLADGFRLYQFNIGRISTAGIALQMNLNQGYNFVKNTVIDNICINLNRKTVVCSGLIYDVRIVGEICHAVILFTKQTTAEHRKSIRNFIYETLSYKFDLLQKNLIPELFDYVRNSSDEEAAEAQAEQAEKAAKTEQSDKAESEKTETKQLDSPEGDIILNEVEDAEEVDSESAAAEEPEVNKSE